MKGNSRFKSKQDLPESLIKAWIERKAEEQRNAGTDVEELQHELEKWCMDHSTNLSLAECLYKAGYRKQKEEEWISVEERLPECRKIVIACDEYGNVGEAYFYKADKKFEWVDDEECAFATHWMPLPEPPKGD